MLFARANAVRTTLIPVLLFATNACSSTDPDEGAAGTGPLSHAGTSPSAAGASGSGFAGGPSGAGGTQPGASGGTSGTATASGGRPGAAGGLQQGGGGASGAPTSGGRAGAGAGGSGGTLASAGTSGSAQGGTTSPGAGSAGAPATGGANGTAPEPSAGCGKANPSTGSGSSPLNVSNHQYYVKLPQNYDPSTAYRLLFVFHPSGNPITWAEQNAGFPQTDAARQAVIVYPKSAGTGWEQVDIAFFDPLYEAITNNFCVDKKRVFATGESSGGDYASVLGCEKATKVRAVGPTAAKPMAGVGLNPGNRTCSAQSAAYVIHGVRDCVVGPQAGIQTRDFHLAKNHCGTMTTPVAGFTDKLSNCVEYSGCDEGYPVFWCQHEDPEYRGSCSQGTSPDGGTNHGWPKFAAKFLWQKFSEY